MAKEREISRKSGVLAIAAGAVLILSALFLFHHNRLDDVRAGQQAGHLLADIEAAIANAPVNDTTSNECGDTASSGLDRSYVDDPELPTVILDGYGYVGYLGIPALALELPVMSEWDYDRLKIAPCRQFGSSRTDDLVIAAHNYQSHFGRLKELIAGDTVIFTDMDGLSNTYSVEDIRILQPTEIGSVQDSGFDLVLYTCTYGGKSRVTVFCSRVSDTD